MMKAAIYDQFQAPLKLDNINDPTPSAKGVVIKVKATGVCRSDWHGWMGHDPDIILPHVPGHEISGEVSEIGKDVAQWKVGDRVTLPFVCGCGNCPQCKSGNQQVCDHQFQPGFTAWGSYADYVAINFADENLVRLPHQMSHLTAASLGCRFATSFRAVVAQGKVKEGDWVAVHGCGGVGLSAIMIAKVFGAQVIGIDINKSILSFAESIGADFVIDANSVNSVEEAVREISKGGGDISIDALGNPETCFNSIACLAKRGKHVQVGLMLAEQSRPNIPMDRVIANELEIYGSHGMQAHCYPQMMEMILQGKLQPEKLIGNTISLEEAIQKFTVEQKFEGPGISVIEFD